MPQDKQDDHAEDRLSGASKLGRNCAQAWITHSHAWSLLSPQEILNNVLSIITYWTQEQPEMAPIRKLCLLIETSVRQALQKGTDANKLAALVRDISFSHLRQAPKALQAIQDFGASWLEDGDSLLTISCSSTFCAIVEGACKAGKEIHVIVGESRPLYEGRSLAKQLGACNIPVTLTTDAALLHQLPECTKVLVGADWIEPSFFINKSGTLALALGAQKAQKPLWIAAETSKIVLDSHIHYLENDHHPQEEVLPYPLQGVQIVNPYFDKVPLDLAIGLITEKGITHAPLGDQLQGLL